MDVEISKFIEEYPVVVQWISAILIFIIGRWIAKLIVGFLGNAMEKVSIEDTVAKFISNFSYMGLIAFVVLMALGKVGVQTNSLVAMVGAAGLAIGLALQGSLSNFAAGIMLVVFKPFKKGDMIRLQGIEGTVEEIHLFTTILRDDYNLCHVLPNSVINGGLITNIWSNVVRRVEFNFNIAYEDDLNRVIEVLDEMLQAHPLLLDDPAPFVGVRSLDDSAVNMMVWVFIHRPNWRNVRFRLYKEIKEALEEHGIVIAFPQCDVHLDKEPKGQIAA